MEIKITTSITSFCLILCILIPTENSTAQELQHDLEGTNPHSYPPFIGSSEDLVGVGVNAGARTVLQRLKGILNSSPWDMDGILKLQAKEFEFKHTNYQLRWNLTTHITYNPRAYMLGLFFPGILKEYHIALCTYTQNMAALYNRETRTINSTEDILNYKYKTLFKFMWLSFNQMKKFKLMQSPQLIHYRGMMGKNFTLEVGSVIRFQQWTSTTKNWTVANWYGPDVLLEIHGNMTGVGVVTEFHHQFKPNRGPEEVLVSPFQAYKVTGEGMEGKKKIYYLKLCKVYEDEKVDDGLIGDEMDSMDDCSKI